MTIEEYIDRQTDLFRCISRALENLRNLGKAKITLGQVQSRLNALNSNWTKFQETHELINGIKIRAKDDQLEVIKKLSYFAKDYYGQCEEQYLNGEGAMLDLLESLKPAAPQTTTGGTLKRLPCIELPSFSGNCSDWKSFHDLFTSIIRENSHLSEVEKLHYLKTSLTGEPSQLIKNIALTSENFTRAWETLVSRYDNKRLLTDSHIATLIAIPRVIKKSSSELKSLHSNTCEALGALELLDNAENHWDHMIVHMTIRKLDPGSLEEWEKSFREKLEPPTFADLKAFLLSRIHTLEAVEQVETSPSKGQSSYERSNPLPTKSDVAQSKEQSCDSRKDNHCIAFCSNFRDKSLGQRKQGVCSMCTNSDTTQEQAGGGQPAPNVPNTNNGSQPTTIKRSPVLLATVQLNASNPETGETIIARALLDQGSECSFITESLTQQLRLPRQRATIPIFGVGDEQSVVTRGITTLQLQSRVQTAFSCRVEALILPRLTAILPSFRLLVEDWPHLRGLDLADPSFGHPSQIDIILGADIWSHIIAQGVRRGAPGTPIAQETQLGWVLSGCVSSEAASISYPLDLTNAKCSMSCSNYGNRRKYLNPLY